MTLANRYGYGYGVWVLFLFLPIQDPYILHILQATRIPLVSRLQLHLSNALLIL